MKISNEGLPPNFRTEATSAKTGSKSSNNAPEAASPADSAEVSDAGRLAAKLQDQSAAKIEQLRTQVRSGNYTVDAGKLGGKIIDSLLNE